MTDYYTSTQTVLIRYECLLILDDICLNEETKVQINFADFGISEFSNICLFHK